MKKTILIIVAVVLMLGGVTAVLAEEVANNTATAAPIRSVDKTKIDLVCMQKAIEVREVAVAAAFEKKTTAVKNALAVRKTALIEAWKKENVRERVAAVSAAWKQFRAIRQNIHKTYQQEIKSSWTKFKQDRKICRGTDANAGGENNGTDLSL